MHLTYLAFLVALIAMLIAILIGGAALQPSHYEVTRTAVINTPPRIVFEQVNNLHKWGAWSPWAKPDDPNQKVDFSGPEAGKDAGMQWSGEAGQGSVAITESQPSERVAFNLKLLRPLNRTSTVEVLLTPQNNGAQTEVRWSAQGERDLLAKAIGLIVNADVMIRDRIGKRLAAMKGALETKAHAGPAPAGPPMPQPGPAASQPAAASEAQPTPKAAPPAAADGAKVSVDVKEASPPVTN